MSTIDAAVVNYDPDWMVTHVGDFDGDGKADLLWRNKVTGVTMAWLMDGVVPKATALLLGDGAWRVTHVADLDGDGKSTSCGATTAPAQPRPGS